MVSNLAATFKGFHVTLHDHKLFTFHTIICVSGSLKKLITTYLYINLLKHVTPSPKKPPVTLHEQLKLPGVLLQVAFLWQLCIPSRHSSRSEKSGQQFYNYINFVIKVLYTSTYPFLSIKKETNTTGAMVRSICVNTSSFTQTL